MVLLLGKVAFISEAQVGLCELPESGKKKLNFLLRPFKMLEAGGAAAAGEGLETIRQVTSHLESLPSLT